MKKPEEFEKELGEYGVVLSDPYCGEPVAWGFPIISHLGEERFHLLKQYGQPECVTAGKWVLVVSVLSREEAIKKYGAITDEARGPRGGWKSTTFGDKKFISRFLKPA